LFLHGRSKISPEGVSVGTPTGWCSLVILTFRKYYVREVVLAGFLKLVPLRTLNMAADALTKSVPSPAFVGHRQIMTGHVPFAARLLRHMKG